MKGLLIVLSFFMTQHLCAQRYWVGTQSSDWNAAGNWSTTSGGPGGASVPGSSDIVNFDRTTPNSCLLNSSVTIAQFGMTGGTISLGSSALLTVNGVFSMSGGNFNAGSGQLAVPSNTFSLNGGTLDAGSSTIYIGSNMTIPAPSSFISGTSTVVFNGTGQQDIVIIAGSGPGTFEFFNLTIDKPGNGTIGFTSNVTDTFQVNNLVLLKSGKLDGSGFVKVEKDLTTLAGFGGTGVPIACTGPNTSTVNLGAKFAVTGVSNFVGVAKSDPSVLVNVYRTGGIDDTLRIGNFDASFYVKKGIVQFPQNPPIISGFKTVQIDPGGTLICTSNYFFNAGQHINNGGTFSHNNGTYVFNYSPIPAYTQFANHNENFYNLIVDIGGGQISPSANDTLIVNGKLTFLNGTLTGQAGSAFNAKGDVLFKSTMLPTQSNTALIFSGSNDQHLLFEPGTEGSWNASMTIDKAGGNLFLDSPVLLDAFGSNTFSFKKGIVQPTGSNYLLFANQYVPAGASNVSFVDGQVQYRWYDAFTFPIGNKGFFAPVRVSAGAESFTVSAQYFHTDPTPQYNTALHAATLQNVSHTEYWMISKNGTGSSPLISLSYNSARSGGITDPSKLRVSHWNGSLWTDEGNGGTDGTFIAAGNIIDNFSPFTLAAVDKIVDPLPVRFVSFSANDQANEGVLLKWQTTDESNNSLFDIQRSGDGISFITIATMPGQNNPAQNNYYFTDRKPLNGKSFYRLRQVDVDGQYTYSSILSVVKKSILHSLKLYPNPAQTFVYISCEELAGKLVTIEVVNFNGAIVQKKDILLDEFGKYKLQTLPAPGLYTVRIGFNKQTYKQSLLIK